jgi:rhodanese-related sulfurtransferase
MTLSKQFLLMLCVSVLLGLGARVVQKNPVPYWGFPKPKELIQVPDAVADPGATAPDSAFVPSDKAYEIKLNTASGLYMSRKKYNIHFLDARESSLYDAGHILGSVNIPFEKLSDYTDALGKMPKTDLYVLYCDGGTCHLSHDLADYMLANGFRRCAVYTGGWAEWSVERADFIEAKP